MSWMEDFDFCKVIVIIQVTIKLEQISLDNNLRIDILIDFMYLFQILMVDYRNTITIII